MSQNKPRYDQIKENDPTNKDTSSEHQAKAYEEFYTEESHVRNVCFVWLDCRRIFMNYSYLVSGEYSPHDNTITLTFTTHVFTLADVNLENLFYDLMYYSAKQIICTETRYNIIGKNEKSKVNKITITTLDSTFIQCDNVF